MPESTPPSDPAASFREGQKLAGCYLLQRRVPDTGPRTVWIAHDEVLGKDVSLHFVPPTMLADEEALAVLRHEVRRNRQLIHPSILRVYDFVEEGDWAAVSMDAFTGGTLAARQAATPHGFFEPTEIKAWLETICQTLDDAHRIKLAHGDVTPENIVVEEDGRVRLANFGMSICIKHALGELEGAGSTHQSAQQIEGAAPTPADDVFGAGVLIHRLVVGAPPFGGPGERGQAPGLAEHRAQLGKSGGPIPEGWEKTVAACLARDPGARPQSAAEIVPGLELAEGRAVPEAAAKEPAAKEVPEKKSKKKTTAPAGPAAAAPEPMGPMSPVGPIVPEEAPAAEPAPAPEPVAAKAEENAAPAPEPEVPKAEERSAPAAEPAPEATKTESAEAAPANIVEAPPGAAKRIPGPESKPEPARSTPRKQPARPLVDDDDDDYGPGGGGGMSGKMVGIAVLGLAAMVAIVMYFMGGDEKKPDVPNRAPEPTPVAKSTPVPETKAATPIPVPTPAPVKPNGPDPKPPVGEQPKNSQTGEVNKEPAPATPKPDKPEAPAPETKAKAAELEAARKGLDAAEKTVQEAQKKKQDADDALAAVKAKIEEKSKSLTPLQKAADEVVAGQKKREADARATALAAEQAKQAVPEKARLSDEARKALEASDESLAALKKMADAYKTVALKKAVDEMTAIHKKREDDVKTAESAATRAQQTSDVKASDADSAAAAVKKGEEDGKAKLAAKESAANELKDLQKDIEDKQRAAAEATKALADAAAKRDQQAALVQNATKEKEAPPANANPKDPAAEVKTAEPPPEVKPTPPVDKPDPEKVKKDGQAMIESLSEKLKHLGDTPPSATVEPKPAPLDTNSPPVTPNPAPADAAPVNPPNAPDTPKAGRAAPGFVNSLGMKFAPVGDVLFCVWQTRFKDFEAFAKNTGLKSTAWRDPGFKQGPEHPVVNVTWNEATLFCKWLTLRERKDGLLVADQEYRLPTDLEWSAGVGLGEEAGKTPESRDMDVPDVYPWGPQWPPPAGAGNYTGEETGSDVAIRGYSDNFPWTSPVGSFPPNKYGLYDMGGNVWQWVMDNWNGESRAKVLRGASWYNGALRLSLLSSCRVHAAPDSSTDNYGFRVIIATTGTEAGGKTSHK